MNRFVSKNHFTYIPPQEKWKEKQNKEAEHETQ